MDKLKIPRYIFISDTGEDTKRSFALVLEKFAHQRLLLITSSSPGPRLEWLFEFLKSTDKKTGEVKISKEEGKALERTAAILSSDGWDLCIGIGGGRILDIAKFASFLNHVPFISFPTLLSHDGIASPVAVIRDGGHWSESRVAESPCAVIIDLETVAAAPEVSLLSGISDLTANMFASLDGELGGAKPVGEYDSLAIAIGRSASQLSLWGRNA